MGKDLISWKRAFFLSSAWTTTFMLVLLAGTVLLSLRTPAISFFIGVWLSVIAEAFIRYTENNQRRKSHYTIWYMLGLLGVGLLIILLALAVITVLGYDFRSWEFQESWGVLQGPYETACVEKEETQTCEVIGPNFTGMFHSWMEVASKKRFLLCFAICICMRTAIYKLAIEK